MKNFSIKQKFFGIFCILFLVIFFSGTVIFYSLSDAREDAEIMNALGRQRVLAREMAQSVFGYSIAKSQKKVLEQQVDSLNHYITQMRKTYTESVIEGAQKAGIELSVDPGSETHPALPFPASFTRMVNEKFGDNFGISVNIISDNPINPQKGLQSELDKEANLFLKNSPNEIFSKVFEEDGKQFIGLYSADKATAPACVSCHSTLQSKKINLGETLGIRHFKLVYSENIALGNKELNADLNEYIIAKSMFEMTLLVMKLGGEFPLDQNFSKWKKIAGIENERVQKKIVEIEHEFSQMVGSVEDLLNMEVNSSPYRLARQKIVQQSDILRTLSDDLIVLYGNLAKGHHRSIELAVVTAGSFTLFILISLAFYIVRVVVKPLQNMSKVLTETVHGNLQQKKLSVNSQDEIGILSQSCNELVDGLRRFIKYSENVYQGNLETAHFNLKGEFGISLEKLRTISTAKIKAEKELREAQVGLENRVKERTSQLSQSNETLKAEISERIKLDLTLQRMMSRNKLILDSAGEGIYGIDLEGKTTFVNPAAEKMLGFSGEDLIGKPQHALIHHSHADGTCYPREECSIYAAFKQGKVQHEVNEVFWRKDGTSFPVEYVSTPIHEKGKIVGAVVTFKDITERKKAENEIILAKEKAEKAEEKANLANRAKSEFLANMSHEIRTPMNAIIGMGDLLAETQLTAEQDQLVNVFRGAGENLLLLINDILDLSKIESGQIELENIEFDPRHLLEKTIEILDLRAQEKGIQLNYHLSPDVPNRLLGDSHRLRQILINLIGNAIKFTEQGEVLVQVKRDRDTDEVGGLLFSVADTGIGIPAKNLGSIFKSFSQGDSSITRNYGGTGLGLAITQKLVEKMQGRIWVESELGEGSRFFFTVKFDAEVLANVESLVIPKKLKKMKALLVEHRPAVRSMIKDQLLDWGLWIDDVDCGNMALDLLQRSKNHGESYSLLLINSRLPGIGGFRTIEKIKKKLGIELPTLVMLPTDARKGDLDYCEKMGFVGYMTKFIHPENLLEKIMGTLENSKAVIENEIEKTAPKEDSPKNENALRILLVEDSEDNRLLVQLYLKKSPHEVDIAENGEVALQKFDPDLFDLVLMDMQMPVLDGYNATQMIREMEKLNGLQETPIIALTAHALKGDRDKCLAAGCTDYVAKPIKKAKLLEVLQDYQKEIVSAKGEKI